MTSLAYANIVIYEAAYVLVHAKSFYRDTSIVCHAW